MVTSVLDKEFGPNCRRRLYLVRGVSELLTGRRFALRRVRPVRSVVKLGNARRRLRGALAHQLRTPLTVVKGYVELLIRSWHSLDDDRRLVFLGVIHNHVEELRGHVDNAILAVELAAIEEDLLRVN